MRKILVLAVAAMLLVACTGIKKDIASTQHAAIIPPPDQFGLPEIIKGFSLCGLYAARTENGTEPEKVFRVEKIERSINPTLFRIRLSDGGTIPLVYYGDWDRRRKIVGEGMTKWVFSQAGGAKVFLFEGAGDAPDLAQNATTTNP
jgi:hypothetical protein